MGLDRQAGDVAARPRQAGDEAAADRIDRDREDDGDCRGRLLGGGDAGARGHHDVDLAAHELGRDLGEALVAAVGPAIVDRDRAALDPAELAKARREGGHPIAPAGGGSGAEDPDGRQLRRLLRGRGARVQQRRHRHAADKGDEFPASHASAAHPVTPA
jgi:hypothetical protein